MTLLEVTVPGTPIGQGRISHVGNGRLVHSNASKLKPWRSIIATSIQWAMNDMGGTWPIEGPVKVAITFYLPRPKTVRRMWPHVRPDIDHLARAALDALTASGAIRDDAQVVMLGLTKCYGTPGMSLTLRPMAVLAVMA